jgi:septal ring factor EnvC (AmiA/AmiB activator)
VDFDAAVARLYGMAPADFIATRNELSKELAKQDQALAKRLRALRRPAVSAWAVNLLARSAADEVGWLLDVGERLREAWAAGDHIGGLEQRRSELIARLVRTARELAADAGQPLRDPAVREIEETLQAATIDPDVAADVHAGRLAGPRSHAGFGPGLGLGAPPSGQAAPAAPRAERAARPPAKRRTDRDRAAERAAELARLEEDDRAAAERAAAAKSDLAEWDERVEEIRREVSAAESEADRLRRELDEVKEREAAANRRMQVTERERNRAARTADTARRRADEARAKLDRARAAPS